MRALSPEWLAAIDQAIASYRDAVSQLITQHRECAAEVGREVAAAQFATLLAGFSVEKVACIAAVALDALAHGEQP